MSSSAHAHHIITHHCCTCQVILAAFQLLYNCVIYVPMHLSGLKGDALTLGTLVRWQLSAYIWHLWGVCSSFLWSVMGLPGIVRWLLLRTHILIRHATSCVTGEHWQTITAVDVLPIALVLGMSPHCL